MDDARNTKKIFRASLHQKRPKGRLETRWKDDVENNIRKMGIANWRQVAQDRDEWRRATRKVAYPSGIVEQQKKKKKKTAPW
jgi:hypothetical protein